jgi:DNA-binding transcriptional LysR family regulator
MELRQLRHFVTLAEEMHYGRAARRLFMTQPPLSASIQRLEAGLGVQLFERDSKRVSITPAGAALLVKAREIVSQAERTRDFAHAIAAGHAGHIEVGFTGILLYRGVAEILTRFRKSYPQVRLALQEISSQKQSELIRAGRLDAGFVNTPVAPPGVASLAIFHDRLVACLPADHRLAKRKSIDLSLLKDEPFVMFTREASPAYYDHLAAMCAASGFQPRIEVEVLQVLSIVALVSAGMGVSVMPQSVARARLSSAVFVPVRGSSLRPSAFLIWPPDSSAPGLAALIETARQ